jgi:hypothetical protein
MKRKADAMYHSPPAPSWANVLKDYIMYPEKHAESILFSDTQLVIIQDKFPKSRTHLLVLPLEKELDGLV